MLAGSLAAGAAALELFSAVGHVSEGVVAVTFATDGDAPDDLVLLTELIPVVGGGDLFRRGERCAIRGHVLDFIEREDWHLYLRYCVCFVGDPRGCPSEGRHKTFPYKRRFTLRCDHRAVLSKKTASKRRTSC